MLKMDKLNSFLVWKYFILCVKIVVTKSDDN